MKYPLIKAIGTLEFAVLAMNAYADQGGSHKGMDMGGMVDHERLARANPSVLKVMREGKRREESEGRPGT